MASASPGYRLYTALYYGGFLVHCTLYTVQSSTIQCTVHYSSGLCGAQWEPCSSPAVTKLPFTQVITRTFITIYTDLPGFPGISLDFLGFPQNRCDMTGRFLTACFRISGRDGEDLWWQWRLISTAPGFWLLASGIYSTQEYALYRNILFTII